MALVTGGLLILGGWRLVANAFILNRLEAIQNAVSPLARASPCLGLIRSKAFRTQYRLVENDFKRFRTKKKQQKSEKRMKRNNSR